MTRAAITRSVITAASVAIVYYAAAKLGLSLAYGTRQVTAIWPPTGVAVAALLLFRVRACPGIFAGALVANAQAAEPLSAAAGIAAGNTAMAVAAFFVLRLARFDQRLGRTRDVVSLVLAAALAAVISASNGAASLALHGIIGWSGYWTAWWVWWVGDATGIILFAPPLLAWLRTPARPAPGTRRRRWWLAETGALFGAFALVSIFSLASPFALTGGSVPVRFLVIPLVIWAAARFGARGATSAVLLVAAVAAWGTVHGIGRFSAGPMDARLIQLVDYLGVLATTGLLLNAIVTEREQARGEVERAAERERADRRFRALLESAPDAMVIVDSAGDIVLVNARGEALFGYSRAELVGLPVEVLLPPRFRDSHPGYRRAYLAGQAPPGANTGREAVGLAKDGREFPAEISLSPLDTPDGPLVSAAIRDVTHRRATEQALRELAVIVESSRDAILAKTLDGIITVWNPAAERVYGYPAAEAMGRHVAMLSPADRKEEAAQLLDRLAHGEQIERFETVHVAANGRLLHVELTLWPIRDHNGAITGASAIARDITGRKRQQEQLRLARRIGDELATSLDPRLAARRLAASLVPALADLAVIDLAEASENGAGSRFRRVAAEPAGAAHAELAPRGKMRAPELTDEAGESSALSLPMRAHGRLIGYLTLVRSVSARVFTADDLAWAVTLADRAGVAFDNGQLYEHQRKTALTLQRSLMGSPAALPGLETAARYLPAADGAGVGGDWFDLIPLDCGRVGIFIGDVMGRGLEAAAVMGQLRSAGRALAKAGLPPGQLMTVLDAVVADLSEQLVTCCYLIVDPAREEVSICLAGHLPALVVGPDAAVRPLAGPVNIPLGVGRSVHQDARSRLPRGSTLVLYTDGLVESRGRDIDEQLGLLTGELRGSAAGSLGLEQTADRILSALLPRRDGHRDDVTLLLARVPGTGLAMTTTHLAAEPQAAAAGRRFVATALAAWGCADVAENACLLTSEIVTNAVQHAHGPLRLGLRRTLAEVSVEVSDRSTSRPEVRPVDPTSEAGRGMLLVDALSDGWGTRLNGPEKTVWFTLRLSAGTSAA